VVGGEPDICLGDRDDGRVARLVGHQEPAVWVQPAHLTHRVPRLCGDVAAQREGAPRADVHTAERRDLT